MTNAAGNMVDTIGEFIEVLKFSCIDNDEILEVTTESWFDNLIKSILSEMSHTLGSVNEFFAVVNSLSSVLSAPLDTIANGFSFTPEAQLFELWFSNENSLHLFCNLNSH